jgi:DNA-directed RNA polymerase specialized sigma24 family protein
VRAFELVVRDDRTPRQAAHQTGLTVRAVYNAKHRILKRIRELRTMLEATE